MVEPRLDSQGVMLWRAASALTRIFLERPVDADEWFDRCGRILETLFVDGVAEGARPIVRMGAWSPLEGWIGSSNLKEGSICGARMLEKSHAQSDLAERVFTRRDVSDDAEWANEELARCRAAPARGDFVEGHFVAPWIGSRCVLFLTADRRDGASPIAWDEQRIVTVFWCLGPAIRDGFVQAVAVPAMRRAEVLKRVSAIQGTILRMLAEGETERGIAEKLSRSVHTVHDHVKTIYLSLGVSSRYKLVEIWNGRAKLAAPEVSGEAVRP